MTLSETFVPEALLEIIYQFYHWFLFTAIYATVALMFPCTTSFIDRGLCILTLPYTTQHSLPHSTHIKVCNDSAVVSSEEAVPSIVLALRSSKLMFN